MSSSASRREAARSGELGRTCGADGPPPRPAHAPVRSGELVPKGGGPDAAAAAVRHEGWMVRYGRRKIGRSFFHTRYFVLDNKLLAYYKKQPNDNNMERSLSQSPGRWPGRRFCRSASRIPSRWAPASSPTSPTVSSPRFYDVETLAGLVRSLVPLAAANATLQANGTARMLAAASAALQADNTVRAVAQCPPWNITAAECALCLYNSVQDFVTPARRVGSDLAFRFLSRQQQQMVSTTMKIFVNSVI